jgi:RHS repeat-associated protein
MSGTLTGTRYYGGIASRTSAGLKWLSADHHGTAVTGVDAATLSATTRRLMPFGEDRGTQPTWPNDKAFVGGTKDPTGLVHLGAREYDPTTGRFISIDPILDLTDPQTWEGYAYAANNPTSFSDPDGLRLFSADGNNFGGWGLNARLASRLAGTRVTTRVNRQPPKMSTPRQLSAAEVRAANKTASQRRARVEREISHRDAQVAKQPKRGTETKSPTTPKTGTVKQQPKLSTKPKWKKEPPNKGGKDGKPDHRDKIDEVVKDAERRNPNDIVERRDRLPTPGGIKGHREPDVTVRDGTTGQLKEIHEVGRTLRDGRPVRRERRKQEEYQKYYPGVPSFFHGI